MYVGNMNAERQEDNVVSEKIAVIELLELYKDLPCLWNTAHKLYFNKDARNQAFQILLEKWKIYYPLATITEIKKKIEHLRAAYRRERNKVESSKTSGAGVEDWYTPALWYYQYLSFLHEKTNPTSEIFDNLDTTTNTSIEDEMGEILDWSMSAVMKLVKEYEKRPQLWDKNHDLYHSHEAKNSSWASIAEVFSCDSHDVRKKFRSVLASYRRERAKVREGLRSTWFIYPHLRFLPQYFQSPGDLEETGTEHTETEHYEEIEALETFSNQSDETHVSEDDQEFEVRIKQEPVTQAFTHEYESVSNTKKRLTRTINKRPQRKRNLANQYLVRTKLPIRMNQCVRTNQTLQSAQSFQTTQMEEMYSKEYVDSKILELRKTLKTESLPRKDDCDTYGEYIASTLRKHDNKTQCRIKQAINNILFEEEMCKYDDPLKNGLQD